LGKDTKRPVKHHFGIFADGGGAFDLPQVNHPESADQSATNERHCVTEEPGSHSLANLLAWIFRRAHAESRSAGAECGVLSGALSYQ
jgi:hypothetical protein